MSIREIRQTLREIYAASQHLTSRKIPPDNPHNAIITLGDIAAYIREPKKWVMYHRQSTTPKNCPWACPSSDACRLSPTCRRMDAYLQRKLSGVLVGLKDGRLVKARFGDLWFIARRADIDPALAQMAAQARAQSQGRSLEMKIDLTAPGGPKLRGV